MRAIGQKYLAVVGSIVTAYGLWCMVPSAHAALLSYEGFDYPAVADKTYLGLPRFGGYNYDGGTGWNGTWFATNNDEWWGTSYTTTGLSFPGLTTVGGGVSNNYHSSDGGQTYDVIKSGGESGRLLSQTYDSGTIYISTLFSQDTASFSAGGRWDRLISTNWDFFLKFGMRRISSTNENLTYFINGQQGTTEITLNTPTYLVAKVNLDSNQASLYAVTDYGTASEATTYTGVTTSFTRNGAVNALTTGYDYGALGTNDEIRIATTFEEAIGKPPIVLAGSTWNNGGWGDWATAANWNNATVPNGVDAIANLDDKITAAQTIFSNSNITLGQLKINNANSYLVQGAGNLTFASTGTALLRVASGTHYVTPAMVEFASNTELSLTGNLVLSGSVNGVVVDAGSTVTVSNGGNLSILGKLHLQGTGSQLILAAKSAGSTGSVLILDGAGVIEGTGSVDISGSSVVVHSSTDKQVIAGLVTTGKLTNANLAANPGIYALGVLNGADFITANNPKIGVYTVLASDVVVRFTYAGDLNLDGQITTTDFAQIDAAYLSGMFASGGATWANGDINHDGYIDATDFALMDAAYRTYLNGDSSIALARVQEDTARFGAAFTSVYDAALASVPEPASLSLLILGVGGFLGRRRK